jgi:Kelch motif/Galactose oxidase, central domain/IPT/TIG domain
MTRRRAGGSQGGELRRVRCRWALWAALLLAAGMLPVVATSAASVAAGAQAVQPPNTWAPTASPMSVARTGHTATVLPDGDVLVAGGGTRTADLYDPSSGTFTPTGSMSVARTNATATLLQSGQVLVAGGVDNTGRQVASAELYDPATGTFTPTGSMHTARSGHTATLLTNGKVLVAGGGCNHHGFCNSGSFLDNLKSAELYNPKSGTWTPTGSMRFEREYFTATLLQNGRVLVAGGFASCDDDFCSDNRQAELYNPTTGTWATTGSMHVAREQFTATLLTDGDVLAAGGLNEGGFSGNGKTYSEAELYNPETGTWTPTGSMSEPRFGQAAVLLPGTGWVLATGGTSDATSEVFEPTLGEWVPTGSMSTPRTDLTATVLSDGNVLATGGTGTNGFAQATAEVYENSAGPLVSISPGSLSFGAQEVGSTGPAQTVTVSNVGTADLHVSGIAVSGADPSDFLGQGTCGLVAPGNSCSVAVRFAPTGIDLRQATVGVADDAPGSPQGIAVTGYGRGPGSWTPTGSLAMARDEAAATLLGNGDVLVAGGENAPYQGSLSDAELYDPSTGVFTKTGSLNVARAYISGALLSDGDVLVAGGYSNVPSALSSVELYDPSTQKWSFTTPMNDSGYGLKATVLSDGDVVVTGFGASPPEVYDPTNATWTDTGALPAPGEDATATLLGDGDVLAAGGSTTAAALYDPATNTWTATGAMKAVQRAATATLVGSGDVLLAGGENPTQFTPLTTSEVYDPSTATWSLTEGQMQEPRDGQAAVELPGGDALVVGGCTSVCDTDQITATTEEFDAQYGYWFSVGSMSQARFKPSATVLGDGDVLVAGGSDYCCDYYASADLFTFTSISVSPASGPAGVKVTLSGRGFYAFEPVLVIWNSTMQVARVKTDSSGSFLVKFKVPAGAPGEYTIEALAQKSFARASTSFQVTP